jgi:hypothetical protein
VRPARFVRVSAQMCQLAGDKGRLSEPIGASGYVCPGDDLARAGIDGGAVFQAMRRRIMLACSWWVVWPVPLGVNSRGAVNWLSMRFIRGELAGVQAISALLAAASGYWWLPSCWAMAAKSAQTFSRAMRPSRNSRMWSSRWLNGRLRPSKPNGWPMARPCQVTSSTRKPGP